MTWREGPEAASDDGHGAKLGPGLVHHVWTGGVLLAVLAIAPLQVVVCAGDGHLHGCSSLRRQRETLSLSSKSLRSATPRVTAFSSKTPVPLKNSVSSHKKRQKPQLFHLLYSLIKSPFVEEAVKGENV